MSVMVLPGRSPVLVAKALASLDRLSDGRLLPAFGLGIADPREQQAFGIGRKERAAVFDEALTIVRALWRGEVLDHQGEHFTYEGVRVRPGPCRTRSRCGSAAGRRASCAGSDAWATGGCRRSATPRTCASGIAAVNQAADEAGRAIDPGHFGALVAYTHDEIPGPFVDFIRQRRPDVDDPHQIIPRGHDGLRARLEEMVEAGATKFVVLPMVEPDLWQPELERLAAAVLPLQT